MAEIVGESYLEADQVVDGEFIRWKRNADRGSLVAQVLVANAYLEGKLVDGSAYFEKFGLVLSVDEACKSYEEKASKFLSG